MEERFTHAKVMIQRNGVTDRVTVELDEELDVSDCESIQVIGIEELKIRK